MQRWQATTVWGCLIVAGCGTPTLSPSALIPDAAVASAAVRGGLSAQAIGSAPAVVSNAGRAWRDHWISYCKEKLHPVSATYAKPVRTIRLDDGGLPFAYLITGHGNYVTAEAQQSTHTGFMHTIGFDAQGPGIGFGRGYVTSIIAVTEPLPVLNSRSRSDSVSIDFQPSVPAEIVAPLRAVQAANDAKVARHLSRMGLAPRIASPWEGIELIKRGGRLLGNVDVQIQRGSTDKLDRSVGIQSVTILDTRLKPLFAQGRQFDPRDPNHFEWFAL